MAFRPAQPARLGGRCGRGRPGNARLERAATAGAAARDKLIGRRTCVPPTPELHGMPKNRIYVVLRSSVGDDLGGWADTWRVTRRFVENLDGHGLAPDSILHGFPSKKQGLQ